VTHEHTLLAHRHINIVTHEHALLFTSSHVCRFDVIVIFSASSEGLSDDHAVLEQLRTLLLTRLLQTSKLAGTVCVSSGDAERSVGSDLSASGRGANRQDGRGQGDRVGVDIANGGVRGGGGGGSGGAGAGAGGAGGGAGGAGGAGGIGIGGGGVYNHVNDDTASSGGVSRADIRADPRFLRDLRVLVEAHDVAGEEMIHAVQQCEVVNTNRIAASVLAQVSFCSLGLSGRR
jgi:hypothetical protein